MIDKNNPADYRKPAERRQSTLNFSQLAKLQTLKKHLDIFQKNHPKFQHFLNAVSRDALREGSVIEIKVTSPEKKTYITNLKLKKDDLDFLQALQQLRR